MPGTVGGGIMPEQVRVKGLAQLLREFRRMPAEIGQKGMRAALEVGIALIRSEISKYPPATAANRPPGLNGYSWYERGFGTRTVTGKGYPTSERLGASWKTEIKGTALNLTGIASTNVSYSRFVQDEELQASFHTRRKWVTAQRVVREQTDKIVKFFQDMIDRVLAMGGRT